MNIAKVAIEDLSSTKRSLHDLDKNLPLSKIMDELLPKFNIDKASIFTLKLLKKQDKPNVSYYINEENLSTIQNADELKIVYTMKYLLERIFKLIDGETKEVAFQDLRSYCTEETFIELLAKKNLHHRLMEIFRDDDKLKNSYIEACLLNFAHLFKKGFINDTGINILDRIIKIAKNEPRTGKCVLGAGSTASIDRISDYMDLYSKEAIDYSLLVLRNILISKKEVFHEWKQQIIEQLTFTQLMKYIWDKDFDKVKYNSLKMINTILKVCKGDRKIVLIKELNLKKNREMIYKHIIASKSLDRDIEHELYVCQTYLLSLFQDALDSKVKYSKDFIDEVDDMTRKSMVLDFVEDEAIPNQNIDSSQNRMSLASILSDASRNSSYVSSMIHFDPAESQDNTISVLTIECLNHYKKKYVKIYQQSLHEESSSKSGICKTSDRVVQILGRILHIGRNPDKSSTTYQPLVFSCKPKEPFFMELFSRTMFLLSKTRREMKATLEDYNKVLHVLAQQVRMVLETKPNTFEELTQEMTKSSFQIVLEHWTNQDKKKMDYLLKRHPCIDVLKAKFAETNREYVLRHRLNFMHSKIKMQMVVSGDRKPHYVSVMVHLSENNRVIFITETDPAKKSKMDKPVTINIENITDLAHGRDCEQSSMCQNDPLRAFSIITDKVLKTPFLAENSSHASYWIDGLSLLINKKGKETELFKNELYTLVEMDIKLKILDLQNVTIPKEPPKIPPTPDKPDIPPKPKFPTKGITRKSQIN